MAKAVKLLGRVENNPKDVRFDDICGLAEAFGFVLKGGKSSHRVYAREGIGQLLNFQKVGGKAKPSQVKQFLNVLKENGLKLEE